MKQVFFLDTSKISEIKLFRGVTEGVTTNQLIMYKEGVVNVDEQIREICRTVGSERPVSVELMDSMASTDKLIEEARRLNSLAENVVVKVPIVDASLVEPYDPTKTSMKMIELVGQLVELGIQVNITAIMTGMQMMLATAALRSARRPNNFISLFWARSLDDMVNHRTNPEFITDHPFEYGGSYKTSRMGQQSYVNANPGEIIKVARQFIGDTSNIKIIVGSIRNVGQVEDAFAAGAHVVTVTPDVMRAGLFCRRTLETVIEFDAAGNNIGK